MGKRADNAYALFMEGYTCSQSLFASFADIFGFDRDTALKTAAGLGGGVGRADLRRCFGRRIVRASDCGTDKQARQQQDGRTKQVFSFHAVTSRQFEAMRIPHYNRIRQPFQGKTEKTGNIFQFFLNFSECFRI